MDVRSEDLKEKLAAIGICIIFFILAYGLWYVVSLFVPRWYLDFFSDLLLVGFVVIGIIALINFIKNRTMKNVYEHGEST